MEPRALDVEAWSLVSCMVILDLVMSILALSLVPC